MSEDTNEEKLWVDVERVLSHHQKQSDATPIDVLNRLFGEYFKGRQDVVQLSKDSCRVRVEKLSWESLDSIVRKDKISRTPRHTGDPVVAVSYGGNMYLIDGRRRVNKWVHERRQDPLKVLILEYRKE